MIIDYRDSRSKFVRCWLVTISLLLIVAIVTPVHIQAATPPQFSRIQAQLLSLATQQPDMQVRVIVQQSGGAADLMNLVTELGGRVTKDLHMIHAFAAELPAQAVVSLANAQGIRWISLDAATQTTGAFSATTDQQHAGGLATNWTHAAANNPSLALAVPENRLLSAVTETVRDEFNTVSFGNNNGSQSWSGDWVEDDTESGGAGPTVGQVRVVNGQLRLDDTPDTYGQPSAARAADLTGATNATLSFDFQTTAGVDYDDAVTVYISSNGGASYTALETFTGIVGSSQGSRTYNISPYVAANTMIRFRVTNKYGASYEYFLVDNVQIAYLTGTTTTEPTTTIVTNKSGRYVRFVATSEVNGNPWTAMAELDLLDSAGNLIPRTNWSVISVDSQETAGEDGRASNAIDGNLNTIWHTAWSSSNPVHPHQIVIDLGVSYNLSGFRYLARQDGWEQGNVANYNFYVSTDGSNWGTPVVSGRLFNTPAVQTVTFSTAQSKTDPVFTTWATALGTVSDIKMIDAYSMVDETGMGPDGYYGYHTGNGKAAFTGFEAQISPGYAISKVEAVFPAFINEAFSKDFKVKTYIAGTKQGEVKVKTDIFYSAIGAANPRLIYVDITGTNNWQWASFANDLQIMIETGGMGGSQTIYYDAIGLRVSTKSGVDTSADNPATALAQPKGAINKSNLVNAFPFAVRAPDVWNAGPAYLQGQGMTIAVVDSGIAKTDDLKGRNVKDINFNEGYHDSKDKYGHGTFVASMIAGDGKKSDGAYMGIAPKSSLLNVRVSDDQGMAHESDVVAALQWIYENKARYNIRVVNLSLNSNAAMSYHVSPLNAAVEVLWFNGIVVVVAAGNNGTSELFSPANDPFVITVGATDDQGTWNIVDDVVPAFSAYGTTEDGHSKPDLVAPGKDIVMYLPQNNKLEMGQRHQSNQINNNYFRMSGTSMAAPIVSGAVAMLLQDEPQLTPDQVKYRLKATANKQWAGYDPVRAGSGYLDIYAAINGTTTASANSGIAASQLLWSGPEVITWGSVSWNSVSWNSVSWNSVSWNSVSWNSVSWNSDYWDEDETAVTASSTAPLRPYDQPMVPAPVNVNPDTAEQVQNHTIFLPIVSD